MEILVDKIRIKNFRALKNVEVNLKTMTVLVGANNSGKTTLLRAINSVLGFSRTQINSDDLFINKEGKESSKEIIIDFRIIPFRDNKREEHFNDKWSSKLGTEIQLEGDNEFFALRTKYFFGIEDAPTISHYIINNWEEELIEPDPFKRVNQIRNNIQLYFIDAQRDILDDSKQRNSFFGKLVSQLDYGENLESLKKQITQLNNEAIDKSEVLKHLKQSLEQLNKTTQTSGEGITLNPFPKKINDLHKGMKVYFQDGESDSFSIENHGMGTRSWASIITVGAFSSWQIKQINLKMEKGEDTDLLFPIYALEEPEAHLHPNAQRTLYEQLKQFKGQKIISTHSPYIAGQIKLTELRHFYKSGEETKVKELEFDEKERMQIKEFEEAICEMGGTPMAHKEYQPKIKKLKEIAKGKLSKDDHRALRKEIFLNRGEILFSRALVLFEGVTEEVALPHFYKKHFDKYNFVDGVSLISVGGKNNYSPFLKLAKFLKIPVFIWSDGDGDTEKKVKNQIKSIYGEETALFCCFIPNDGDFEQFLLDSDYKEEIEKAIDSVKEVNYIASYIEEFDGEKGKGGKIRDYKGSKGAYSAILDCMRENKTKFAEKIAEEIILSNKPLPDLLKKLFDEIQKELKFKGVENE